jgi:hypothetical protein
VACQEILCEVTDRVAVVAINRPERMTAPTHCRAVDRIDVPIWTLSQVTHGFHLRRSCVRSEWSQPPAFDLQPSAIL